MRSPFCWFKSNSRLLLIKNAEIAKWLRRWIANPLRVGSTPTFSSIQFKQIRQKQQSLYKMARFSRTYTYLSWYILPGRPILVRLKNEIDNSSNIIKNMDSFSFLRRKRWQSSGWIVIDDIRFISPLFKS